MKKENDIMIHKENTAFSDYYDKYAAPVYGRILNMVNHVPIADRILEQVFIKSNLDQNDPATLQSPLVKLINQASGKTQRTLKALEIFKACCAGTSICIKDPD